MPQSEAPILQVVPHLPATNDGVGDYALTLARRLRASHGFVTTFLVSDATNRSEIDEFQVVPFETQSPEAAAENCSGAILHYVNYGYEKRGVPSALRDFVRELRPHLSGRLVTMFHELYASGSPWQSAFWLRRWQVRIARDLMRLSDTCIASNDVIAREIRNAVADKPLRVVPIMSNFGEPQIDSAAPRDSHLWAICGGTALIERSLRTLASIHRRIPRWCAPERVELIGGRDTDEVRKQTERIPLEFQHYPEISANAASQLLRRCAFGWLDYYGTGKVWPGMIFKSGSFAACCAHAVVPVLAHDEPPLHMHGDFMPGPFFVTESTARFPAESHVMQTREQIYRWYQVHASSGVTARVYAEALR